MVGRAGAILGVLLLAHAAAAQFAQQGGKVVGSGAVGAAHQGYSVAVSADGSTAIVSGYGDNAFAGAAWVFTRDKGVWSQEGSKLVGTGAAGGARFGKSVAVSGEGNTAIVGAPYDNANTGAAWVFTRSAGVWSQAGGKLAGTGAVGAANQGAVAISADATTVIAGGSYDDAKTGAAWVFVNTSCTPPAITAPPQSRTVESGQTATLSVTATGTTALTYQWYQGSAGDTSAPVGADASTFTTPPLIATTIFWVRVTNAYGAADSAAATVTVGRRARRHLHGLT